MKYVWAIYIQFYPDLKYDPLLESLWSNEELANIELLRLRSKWKPPDNVFIVKLRLDGSLQSELQSEELLK